MMLGAAQGLTYLDEKLEVEVIYHDFKSSNVILDNDFKSKFSDFELAREGSTGITQPCFHSNCGEMGVMQPLIHGNRTSQAKSDVWSFGVVLDEDPTRWTVPRKQQI
ncbi:hypothetical protein T459_00955 [Capsicum annuum]|uniref:Protein kinase domain-containing protein n=1 Tax=Capsicum annuum TaxID=4072 RepID=A0A2G3AFV8_CAPAN|nr:hypothetical protein T459_00955 [Capsicum annuum]